MPIRAIPSRPSLEVDRKQAKRLLRAAREGESAALERFATGHPRFSDPRSIDASKLKLADAALVIARDYGFASWPRYEQFVEALLADQQTRAATLLKSVCSNQLSRGVALLEREPQLATFDFYTACACGERAYVEAALEREPQLAQRAGGANGWEPLLYVCFSRFWRRDSERAQRLLGVARLLLERGAAANSRYFEQHGDDRQAQACIFAAAGIANHAGLTKLLLDAGAQVDENEALYHATEFKDVTCLRLLLEAKPRPSGTVTYCLSRALDFDNEAAALLYLQHGANAQHVVPWNHHRSHLHKAVIARRSLTTIRALLEGGADPNLDDDTGQSPYRLAVRRGAHAIAALLEEFGAQRESVTDQDRAVGELAQGKSAPGSGLKPELDLLVRAARRGDLDEMRRLLAAGADPNATDDLPPLHGACYAGQLAAARLLVEHGASLTLLSSYGGTALGTCIYGSADCFDEEGGPSSRLPEEVPARDYAQLVDYLLERGATPPQSISGGSDAVQEALRRRGVPDPAS
jgi:ankyrin repeat protein